MLLGKNGKTSPQVNEIDIGKKRSLELFAALINSLKLH